MLRSFAQKFLKSLAQKVIKRQKPIVIGITGSVGKTTTKQAVYSVISSAMSARRSEKSFNNEIGLPLTVIGAWAPGRSPFKWLHVFIKGFFLSLIKLRSYPRALVLEMAADRPGDIKYLCEIAQPDISIVIAVGLAHSGYLGDLDAVAKEKSTLVKYTKRDGFVILNADDERVMQMRKYAKTDNVLTFGLKGDANISASEIAMRRVEEEGEGVWGVAWKLRSDGSTVPMFLKGVVGRHAVYAGCAAAACGVALGMHLVQIGDALRTISTPRGRMSVLTGIKKTTIIDDSYNSSPQALRSALETLGEMDPQGEGRRVAVLGDMLELGEYTESEHYDIGMRVVENRIDLLITIGEKSRDIERGAKNAGMREDIMLHFPDSNSAKKVVQDRVREGDIILVKGSQSMRMERIVKEIMAEPERASELLARQDPSWLAKP